MLLKNLSLRLKGKSSEITRENLKVGKNPQFNYSVIRTSSFEESTSRQKLLYKMEFPGDWTVLGEADFEIAAARDPGALGMDVMAQVRDNGRVVDHMRVVLGGNRPIKARFHTKDIFPVANIPDRAVSWEVWPRDITIRRNMTTSEWFDVINMVAANDVLVSLGDAPNGGNEELIAFLNGLTGKRNYGASIRWAVCVGVDKKMELVLQGLPATAAFVSGKPTLRG